MLARAGKIVYKSYGFENEERQTEIERPLHSSFKSEIVCDPTLGKHPVKNKDSFMRSVRIRW